MTLKNDGELLIGTTTDAGAYALQVAGSMYTTGNLIMTGSAAIRNSVSQFIDYGTGGSGDLYFRGGSGFSNVMTLTNAGNVGIGTSSPSVKLDIGTTADQSFGIKSSTSNYLFAGTYQNYAIFAVNRNPSTGVFTDANKATADIAIGGLANDGVIIFNTTASNNSTATERIRIHSNGGLKFVPQSAAPTAEAGTVYYDSDDNKLKVYNGTTWVDLH
jgi:hypothetical protein